MSRIKSVSFIGSGNVATHLAKALESSGINVKSIYSRNINHAKQLGDEIGAKSTDKISEIAVDSDLFIFSVKDNVIGDLAKKLKEKVGYDAFVAHTSGMVASEIFKEYFNDFGVFYPLQTFRKARNVEVREVPFLITGSSNTEENILFELASMISDNVHFIDDAKRKILHVAAVFANNFTNFMYSISYEIVQKENIDFQLLKPLIKETAMKIVNGQKPKDVQTGPAVRNDINTINAHLSYLSDYTVTKRLYQMLTESIIEANSLNNADIK